jgi:hypothetical protein
MSAMCSMQRLRVVPTVLSLCAESAAAVIIDNRRKVIGVDGWSIEYATSSSTCTHMHIMVLTGATRCLVAVLFFSGAWLVLWSAEQRSMLHLLSVCSVGHANLAGTLARVSEKALFPRKTHVRNRSGCVVLQTRLGKILNFNGSWDQALWVTPSGANLGPTLGQPRFGAKLWPIWGQLRANSGTSGQAR